jgi:hypothetical protein
MRERINLILSKKGKLEFSKDLDELLRSKPYDKVTM